MAQAEATPQGVEAPGLAGPLAAPTPVAAAGEAVGARAAQSPAVAALQPATIVQQGSRRAKSLQR